MTRLLPSLILSAALLASACTADRETTQPGTAELASTSGGAARGGPTEGGPTDPDPSPESDPKPESEMSDPTPSSRAANSEVATFAAGCFWCVEAVLEQIDGVIDVESGYMGGRIENPTYDQVCSGTTGHAEVVQITFDPSKISYADLLAWFWQLHDPTTLNRQGADVGTQYRSAIFCHSDAQRDAAVAAKAAAQSRFLDPIVTEISPATAYYPADQYHQDYYRANRQQGYCRMVIAPKLDKLGLEK